MAKSVVIVHGLFMNTLTMRWLEKNFRRLGYHTYNFSYTTRHYSPLTLHKLHQFCQKIPDQPLLFLGHSMGGLVIHQYLKTYLPDRQNIKVVTLGTPFNGSTVARHLSETSFSKLLFGKDSTQDILTGGIKSKIGHVATGSIIGTRNVGIGRFFGIPEGDGTVSYQDVHINWALDEALIHANHFGLLRSKKAVQLADSFFKHGHF